jgi:hypothetical protein
MTDIAIPLPGRRRLPRLPFGWSFADHAASAGSNAMVVLTVTKWEGLVAAGHFAVAYSLFLLVLGLCRALVGEPILQLSATQVWCESNRRRQLSACGLLFTASGAFLLVSGLVVGGDTRRTLSIFAFAAPALLLQDYQRHQLFGLRRYELATASDAVWLAGSLVAFFFAPSLPMSVAAWWALSGVVSAFVSTLAVVLAGRKAEKNFGPAGTQSRWRGALVGNFVMTQGSAQAVMLIVAAEAGAAAAGALRAVATPYGLLFVLYTSIGVVLLTQPGRTSLTRLLLIFAAAAGLGMLAIALSPDRLGTALFGIAGWHSVQRLSVPIGLSLVGQGWVFASSLEWRIRDQATRYVRMRAFALALPLVGCILGAELSGAMGAAIGLAGAHLVAGATSLGLTFAWMRADDLRRPANCEVMQRARSESP